MPIAARFPRSIDIQRPLPPSFAVLAALAALMAGAAYCMGYSLLSGSSNEWARAIGWSAGAVLPWLIAFELIKRRPNARWPAIVLSLVVTGAISLGIEAAVDRWIWGTQPAPVALQLLRRLPAIGVVLMLLGFGRSSDAAESQADTAPIPATGLRLVRAADNYVELHFAGHMEMRRETLARMEKRLSGHGFVRVHRSLLVHPRSVVRIQDGGRTPALVLDDGTCLPTGERYRAALRHFVP